MGFRVYPHKTNPLPGAESLAHVLHADVMAGYFWYVMGDLQSSPWLFQYEDGP